MKERRLIDRNPVGNIRRKRESRGRTRFLSDEERTALLAACAQSDWPALHALVLLAITTGARRGELVSLKWADVDLKAGRAILHDTKNGEQRTLPLAAQGASLLEIADVLGHKTLAMVKRYSHLVVDHKAKVIEKMVAAKGL